MYWTGRGASRVGAGLGPGLPACGRVIRSPGGCFYAPPARRCPAIVHSCPPLPLTPQSQTPPRGPVAQLALPRHARLAQPPEYEVGPAAREKRRGEKVWWLFPGFLVGSCPHTARLAENEFPGHYFSALLLPALVFADAASASGPTPPRSFATPSSSPAQRVYDRDHSSGRPTVPAAGGVRCSGADVGGVGSAGAGRGRRAVKGGEEGCSRPRAVWTHNKFIILPGHPAGWRAGSASPLACRWWSAGGHRSRPLAQGWRWGRLLARRVGNPSSRAVWVAIPCLLRALAPRLS